MGAHLLVWSSLETSSETWDVLRAEYVLWTAAWARHEQLSLLRDTGTDPSQFGTKGLADKGKIVSKVGNRLCSCEHATASREARMPLLQLRRANACLKGANACLTGKLRCLFSLNPLPGLHVGSFVGRDRDDLLDICHRLGNFLCLCLPVLPAQAEPEGCPKSLAVDFNL